MRNLNSAIWAEAKDWVGFVALIILGVTAVGIFLAAINLLFWFGSILAANIFTLSAVFSFIFGGTFAYSVWRRMKESADV